MRITGGNARGIPIKAPKGAITRPATDRLREAIFSSLGDHVVGSRVVDLFAGTGAYGLEAISRGAIQATFYETNRKALACLNTNRQAVFKSCGLEDTLPSVTARDVYAPEPSQEAAELIFVDPPYAAIESRLEQILAKINLHATPDTRLIFEFPGNLELAPVGWKQIRHFGQPKHVSPNAAIFTWDHCMDLQDKQDIFYE